MGYCGSALIIIIINSSVNQQWASPRLVRLGFCFTQAILLLETFARKVDQYIYIYVDIRIASEHVK